jgi:hypothetical protein
MEVVGYKTPTLGKEFLCREPNDWLSTKKFEKNHFLASKPFLFSTYTNTKLMLKLDTILTLFAIFNYFTLF